MRRSRDRGAALASMMTVAALLLVVALALAALSLHSLRVAQGFHDGARGELLAQAAVEQFIAENQGTSTTGSPLDTEQGVDFLERYRDGPVFPDGGEKLGGEVSITFDPALPYYSVDNSESELPAASWSDRGTGRRSVPPYSVSLVVSVKDGQQTTHYEAILQRRWPYACAVPRTMLVNGLPRPATATRPGDPSSGVSSVFGNTFLMGERISVNPPSPGTLMTGEDGRGQPMVPVANDLYESAAKAMQMLRLSGDLTVGQRGTAGGPGPQYLPSVGNVVRGRVDALRPGRHVSVEPGNEFDGAERSGVGDPQQLARFGQKLFRLPSPYGYRDVSGQFEALFDPDLPPGPYRGAPNFLLLSSDVELRGTAGSGDLRYGSNSRFYLPVSAGNRYFEIYRQDGDILFTARRATGKSLTLQDCMLYVDGNLDLSSEQAEGDDLPPYDWRRPETPPLPGLRGTNSTLIVNGSLVLTNGVLDARDRGMVIYCQRLVMQARGHFRGLIIVEESALIYPGGNLADPDGLHIDGAIICGGRPFEILKEKEVTDRPTPQPEPSPDPSATPSPTPSPSPSPEMVDPTLTQSVEGLLMWTTAVKYDPRYLKSIHQFGDFHLIALRRLQ